MVANGRHGSLAILTPFEYHRRMPATEVPKAHVRTFDLTQATDVDAYEELLAGESEFEEVRVINSVDFPMGGSGAIMRVVDFKTVVKPSFPYQPPIC